MNEATSSGGSLHRGPADSTIRKEFIATQTPETTAPPPQLRILVDSGSGMMKSNLLPEALLNIWLFDLVDEPLVTGVMQCVTDVTQGREPVPR